MKANCYFGPYDVRVVDWPDPKISEPTDAIVRLTTGAICGSDLHVYHGRYDEKWKREGFPVPHVVGHEFVGVVEEVGAGVSAVEPGDRVVGAFRTSCGHCEFCRRNQPAACVHGAVFGVGLEGVHAEYVRVPLADTTLEKVPASLADEQVIFVGDIFSTGYMAAENGQIRTGDLVAVFGCGPVGLFAQLCCNQFFGPSAVFAVDKVPDRLERARELGSIPIDAGAVDPVEEIKRQTNGRGVDVAIEAIGVEPTLLAAINSVRPSGRVSVVGVFAEPSFPFPIGQAFFRGISLTMGSCHVQRYMPMLIPVIARGKVDLTRFISHTMPLADAPKGFAMFDKRQALKILLKP